MKDAEGTEIKVGDKVIGAHNCGNSSCRPSRWTVIGFTPKRVRVQGEHGECLIHPHICIII